VTFLSSLNCTLVRFAPTISPPRPSSRPTKTIAKGFAVLCHACIQSTSTTFTLKKKHLIQTEQLQLRMKRSWTQHTDSRHEAGLQKKYSISECDGEDQKAGGVIVPQHCPMAVVHPGEFPQPRLIPTSHLPISK
jgi:hypothetical protein